jgi:casein kinase II subunit beta
MEGG